MVENNLKKPQKEMPVENEITVKENNSQLKIPEKFKDPKTGELKTEELLKSYLALEKKLGERSASSVNGTRPNSPEEYDIKVKNELITVDPEVNQFLFDAGFTNEQVQVVYDLAVEKVLPLLNEISADYKADQELYALENAFGGAEQFNAIARQISAWGEKNLNPEIYEALSTSKDGILTMYKMMSEGAEPSIMKEGVSTPVGMETEASLRELMKDPRYWKKQDPAFMRRIEEGFKRLYK